MEDNPDGADLTNELIEAYRDWADAVAQNDKNEAIVKLQKRAMKARARLAAMIQSETESN